MKVGIIGAGPAGITAAYELVKRGELCAPIKLGVRASAWPASAIDQFIADRISAARGRR